MSWGWSACKWNCCSVTQSPPTLGSLMDRSTPGLSVSLHLPKFVQVHVHCIGDDMQPSYPLMPSSPSALSLSQHQGLFQWVSCWHQVTKILEFQLQHQSSNKYSGLISLTIDWSLCYSRDFLESSPAPQFEGIDSSEFCLLYPAVTTLRGHWEDHSLDIWTFAARVIKISAANEINALIRDPGEFSDSLPCEETTRKQLSTTW